MQNIKNIIFDLGGVFLGIDYNKTEKAFIDLGVKNFSELYNQHHANSLFENLETGRNSPEEFCNNFCETAKVQLSSQQIEKAWNAMLGDFSPATLEWLEKVSKRYKVYLLSNSNIIHYKIFQQVFRQQTGKQSFDDYFIKAYYSHDMGIRKPYPEAFKKLLENENLKAEETLFIDDTAGNVEGAKKAGLQTIHLQEPNTVLDLDL